MAAANATALMHGFARAMDFTAVLCALGGLIAFLTIRTATAVADVTQPSITVGCHHPDVREVAAPAA